MRLDCLRGHTLLYLGSPYSRYSTGTEAAFVDVCKIAAALIRSGIPIFCPISHSHPIAMHGGIDPLDHSIWLRSDAPMMQAASGMIVAAMDGWQESFGIAEEIRVFRAAAKPIFMLEPALMTAWLVEPEHAP